MPLYEYICKNPECPISSIPERQGKNHNFEASASIADRDVMPKCPLCQSDKFVERVKCYSFPTSQSWKT
jgi:hypothetical protein